MTHNSNILSREEKGLTFTMCDGSEIPRLVAISSTVAFSPSSSDKISSCLFSKDGRLFDESYEKKDKRKL